MALFIILLALVLVLLALTFIHCLKLIHTKLNRLPPGPVPLPIIGNLHQIFTQPPHIAFARLAKTYGPVMRIQLGQLTTIVISSAEMAKQVLQKQDHAFSRRAILDATHAHEHFKYSVVFLPAGSRWRFLRKVMNANIFSGSRLESNQELRSQKVQELIVYCRNKSMSGEGVDIGQAAFTTTLNMLSNIIFSRDLADFFSDSATEFKGVVRNIMLEAGKPNLADVFPFLRKLDPQGIRRRISICFRKLFEIFDDLINERLEQQKNLGVAQNDVLDVLLKISRESPEEIDRTGIKHLCLTLFVAGTDATSSTVEWAMAEMLRHPEIMKTAKIELKNVIGEGKMINELDITHLPYLQCLVKETLRLHPPAPFLIPRRADEDVEICSYEVPKNTQVLVNTWAVGMDSDLWENPLEFKPERFLSSAVDFRGTDFELIPFGAGRRICPGVPLAARMIPVILGSLLNSFDWKLDNGINPKELDMAEMFGFTLQKAIPLDALPLPL